MEEQEKSLGEGVFEFTFTKFVTPKIVGALYGVEIALAAVFALGLIVTGFMHGGGWGLIAIIVSALVFVCLVLTARVALEGAMLIFWIADELKEIGRSKQEEE